MNPVAPVPIDYQIAPGEGGWTLVLRVAELPGGLFADQLGRTLVLCAQGSLSMTVSTLPPETAH